jgi:hypothetical protein
LQELEGNRDRISKNSIQSKNKKGFHKSIGLRAINFGVAAH